MRRFRRRRRAACVWADQTSIAADFILPAGNTVASVEMLPPTIVLFKGVRETMVVQKIRVWQNIFVTTASGGAAVQIPDLQLFIVKSTRDDAGNFVTPSQPFANPIPPGSVASWDADPGEGTRKYLWTCKYFTSSVAPALIGNLGESNTYGFNIGSPGDWGALGYVLNPYYPSFEVRTKRRMNAGENLVFGVRADQQVPAGMTITIKYAWRIWAT